MRWIQIINIISSNIFILIWFFFNFFFLVALQCVTVLLNIFNTWFFFVLFVWLLLLFCVVASAYYNATTINTGIKNECKLLLIVAVVVVLLLLLLFCCCCCCTEYVVNCRYIAHSNGIKCKMYWMCNVVLMGCSGAGWQQKIETWRAYWHIGYFYASFIVRTV